jgi:hypothetical protein
MTPSEKEMLQEVADKKAAVKADKAYMGSLTSTQPAPAPKPEVKKAKGGMTASKRADGCAMRGKTRGRMV